MKGSVKCIAFLAWLILGALGLTFIWGGNPNLLPHPPERFAVWLSNLAGAENAEDMGRLDVIYMLVVSFVVLGLFTSLLYCLVRMVNRCRR